MKATWKVSWTSIYTHWTARLAEAGVKDIPLFSEVRIQDTACPNRPEEFDWVLRTELFEFQMRRQRWVMEFPGTCGPIGDERNVTGWYTLRCLWEHRGNEEETAALLMLSMIESYARRRKTTQSDQVRQNAVWDAATDCLGYIPEWNQADDEIIPSGFEWRNETRVFDRTPSTTVGQIVDFLAEEHSIRLRRDTAAVLVFSDTMDPIVNAILDRERSVQEWDAVRLVRLAQREEKRCGAIPGIRILRPSVNRLGDLSRKELARLIWSKPACELALELDVSDWAIGKRCDSLGIERPPPGFWSKVQAGGCSIRTGYPAG